jgi:thiamine-monophosphate kinase
MNTGAFGEDDLIKTIRNRFKGAHPRLLKGPGDDTSVTAPRPGTVLLATTDILIEGTHFKRRYTAAYLLGKKALSVSLSDIAAMGGGGGANFYLVSIGLPRRTDKKFILDLYRGITARAREFGAVLAGGNTALSDRLIVSTTLFAEMPARNVIYRTGARPGDTIYVTGTPGDSALGLRVLKRDGAGAIKKSAFRRPVSRHLDPSPRVKAGMALSSAHLANSMIDISDGLLLDLERLTRESGVGAVVDSTKLPLSTEFKRYRKGLKRPSEAIKLALTGGEDYELLFTAPERAAKRIAAISKRLRLRITPIGYITAKPRSVTVMGTGPKPLNFTRRGFSHF